MKLGIMLYFFDFRNDIRRLIMELNKYYQVVIFVRKEHEETVKAHLPKNIEYRIINERKAGIYSSILKKLYFVMRKIPKSKSNYYLMEEFKIGNITNSKIQKKAHFLLKIHKWLPHVISYDRYLKLIKVSKKTIINDITTFLCLTEIYDDHLFSRLVNEEKKIFIYVYSWDHAFKHTRFSKKVEYFVWSEGIKDDLINIQQINPNKIHVTGSTQLGYLFNFKIDNTNNKYSKPYYYYGCGIGILSLVDKEISLIQKLSETISRINKNATLVVRPYPNNKNWDKYQTLLKNNNIVFDDGFRQKDLSVNDSDITQKFQNISDALGFFHIGTTLGLETCHVDCPTFIINIEKDDRRKLNVFNFVNQRQNKKYLIDQSRSNTINSIEELENVITDISNVRFMELNYKIRSQFPVKSFEQIGETIANIMRE